MRFENKVVVVTGASSGMGRQISYDFAKEGATVLAVARREQRLVELKEEVEKAGFKGQIVPFVGDLSSEETNVKIIEEAYAKFGKVDVLINNAGVLDNFAPIDEVTNDTINKVFTVDVFAPFYSTRKYVQELLARDYKGTIVNIASIAGICGGKAGVAYTMAKHAVVGLTENVGFLYRKNGIRCNCICPGGIDTEMTAPSSFAGASQKGLQNAMLATALGIPNGKVEDVSALALFLASEESSYINAKSIALDGGLTSW